MQQPPTQHGQWQSPQQGQWQQPYPPQQGQWNQGPYTPYPPQQQYTQYPPQQGQWQQPPPNMQWQQPYGQPPPQQPKKKSGKLKWVLISLGVLLVLCIGACALVSSAFNAATKQTTTGTIITPTTSDSSSSTTSTSNSTSSSSSNTTSTSNSTSAPVVGKVGDTITVDNVGCMLVSVKTLSGDGYIDPKPGNEFIVVHIKIHN